MPYAHHTLIATELAERMGTITLANGFDVEAAQVIRNSLGTLEPYTHGTIQVRVGDIERDTTYLGQWPWARWQQVFSVGVTVRPPKGDALPIDDHIGIWAQAVVQAANTEDQLGGLVDTIQLDAIRLVIEESGDMSGFVAEFGAAYVARENDLSGDTYGATSSLSESDSSS